MVWYTLISFSLLWILCGNFQPSSYIPVQVSMVAGQWYAHISLQRLATVACAMSGRGCIHTCTGKDEDKKQKLGPIVVILVLIGFLAVSMYYHVCWYSPQVHSSGDWFGEWVQACVGVCTVGASGNLNDVGHWQEIGPDPGRQTTVMPWQSVCIPVVAHFPIVGYLAVEANDRCRADG